MNIKLEVYYIYNIKRVNHHHLFKYELWYQVIIYIIYTTFMRHNSGYGCHIHIIPPNFKTLF